MSFTFEDIKQVAELRFNRGYEIVLDSLQAQIDTLTSRLHETTSESEERHILSKWRALREVLSTLKTCPEHFALDQQQAQMLLEVDGPVMPNRNFSPPQRVLTPEALEILRKEYETRCGINK